MAMRTIPALTFPAPNSFPTAGYGGSYYNQPYFNVPTYDDSQDYSLNWGLIETYGLVLINRNSAEGIAAGLTWATFIYILALTPNSKRTSRFHSCLLLGVALLLLHLMIDLISAGIPGLTKYSAYAFLINDGSTIYTTRFRSIQAVSMVTNILSYICASICLWIQTRSLMTGVRVRVYPLYVGILIYLVLTSTGVIVAQMGYVVRTMVQIGRQLSKEELVKWKKWSRASSYALAISIGSYSMVSMLSIINIVWKRPLSLVKGPNAYASALNLMGLLCAQSFVLPFVFCVLMVASNGERWWDPTVMLLPTIFLIIPLGSLFMTINQNDGQAQKKDVHYKVPMSPTKPTNPERDRSPTLTNNTDPSSSLNAFLTDVEPGHHLVRNSICSDVDRELAEIDAMDSITIDLQQNKSRKIASKGTPRPDSSVLREKMV